MPGNPLTESQLLKTLKPSALLRWRRLSLPALWLVAALAIFCVIAVISYHSIDSVGESSAQVEQTHRAIGDLEELLSNLKDAETGQRGYLASGDQRFLTPYNRALAALPESLRRLEESLSEHTNQRDALVALGNNVRLHLRMLAAPVEARRSSKRQSEAEEAEMLIYAKYMMDDIRTQVGVLQQQEESLLARRRAEEADNAHHTKRLIIIGNTCAIILLLSAFYFLHRENQRRRDAEALARRRAHELEAANKELESFTYTVSHDLRAPLRAINGFAMMLQEDFEPVLDNEGKRLLGVVRGSATRMGMLIDDLLSFSRLGRTTLQHIPIDMRSLIDEIIAELSQGQDLSRTRIEIGELPHAQGDRALLRQAWSNLLQNAFKYSSRGDSPVVQIDGKTQDEEIVYCVSDNGVGFDMQYYGKLFGVFHRLHDDNFPGTGVGLAIVKRVVERHGGRVWAESEIDRGARFYFSLPRSRK